SAPALWELEQAAPMLRTGLQGPNTDMLVTKHGRRDPDWSDAGFELLGHTAPRGTDAEVMPILYTSWGTLPRVLQVDVTEHTPRR
ncbi:MAG: hypothetical protein ACLGIA_14350, partial [Actinomycetes bacterium]